MQEHNCTLSVAFLTTILVVIVAISSILLLIGNRIAGMIFG
jgi:hypothetical protein